MINFVKYASSRAQIGSSNQQNVLNLDGLIPRILQVDYQVKNQEILTPSQPPEKPDTEKDQLIEGAAKKPGAKIKEEQKSIGTSNILQKGNVGNQKNKKNKVKNNNNRN